MEKRIIYIFPSIRGKHFVFTIYNVFIYIYSSCVNYSLIELADRAFDMDIENNPGMGELWGKSMEICIIRFIGEIMITIINI